MRLPAAVGSVALLIALFIVDYRFLPSYTVAILYAVPIFYAGRSQTPQTTGLLCVIALVLTIVDSALDSPPPAFWPVSTVGLVLVAYLAIDTSLRRQREADREHDLERRVNLAESMRQPLTVILGTAQLLQRKVGCEHHEQLKAIEDAASRIESIIRQMLANP